MGLPRNRYVQEGIEGVYHCFSRCVRRAFLYGYDEYTGKNYSHRKAWIVDRLRELTSIFAIEVCAYDVLDNHYHTILRTRPDIGAVWSDREVAIRWLTLCPRNMSRKGIPIKEQINVLVSNPEYIEILRKRLSNLSWFMGQLNEFIARAANKEDGIKGRFWESRFKSQVLLDDTAILAGMVYVDLNTIRAGKAKTPEESDFTSIQERIRAWYRKNLATEKTGISTKSDFTNDPDISASWLCPIESKTYRRGILPIKAAEYIDLVDRSGRMIRSDKQGAIDADLAPILKRLGANPDKWADTVSCFEERFRLVA